MFDEQPDGDPHGECAVEIARLKHKLNSIARWCLLANDLDITYRGAIEQIAIDVKNIDQPAPGMETKVWPVSTRAEVCGHGCGNPKNCSECTPTANR